MGTAPVPAGPCPRLALTISSAVSKLDAAQIMNEKTLKATSAWAAWQTLPRQKKSFPRKTPRAMQPENQKSALVRSKGAAM
jgi:hypothetical protein